MEMYIDMIMVWTMVFSVSFFMGSGGCILSIFICSLKLVIRYKHMPLTHCYGKWYERILFRRWMFWFLAVYNFLWLGYMYGMYEARGLV